MCGVLTRECSVQELLEGARKGDFTDVEDLTRLDAAEFVQAFEEFMEMMLIPNKARGKMRDLAKSAKIMQMDAAKLQLRQAKDAAVLVCVHVHPCARFVRGGRRTCRNTTRVLQDCNACSKPFNMLRSKRKCYLWYFVVVRAR